MDRGKHRFCSKAGGLFSIYPHSLGDLIQSGGFMPPNGSWRLISVQITPLDTGRVHLLWIVDFEREVSGSVLLVLPSTLTPPIVLPSQGMGAPLLVVQAPSLGSPLTQTFFLVPTSHPSVNPVSSSFTVHPDSALSLYPDQFPINAHLDPP